MDECVFCKIAAGEIPANKIYEDENFVAFFDIAPVAPNHILLIPKEHHRWFYDLPEALYIDMFQVVKRLSQEMKEKYDADYVRLGIVGTDVSHVHIHLIPLKIEDKGKYERVKDV